jgi:hypothetical protein
MTNMSSSPTNCWAVRQVSGNLNETKCSQARGVARSVAPREHLNSLAYSLLARSANALSRSDDGVVESGIGNQSGGGKLCRLGS